MTAPTACPIPTSANTVGTGSSNGHSHAAMSFPPAPRSFRPKCKNSAKRFLRPSLTPQLLPFFSFLLVNWRDNEEGNRANKKIGRATLRCRALKLCRTAVLLRCLIYSFVFRPKPSHLLSIQLLSVPLCDSSFHGTRFPNRFPHPLPIALQSF